MTKTTKTNLFGGRLTPARVAILGMLLALLITFKFLFGFVPGVEVVTFMFIFLALFLPFLDLILLVAAFNCLVLVVYGFGGWWIAYWPIFLIDVVVSFSLRKLSKHRFFFAFICFLGGVSVGFWYFLSDMMFFGKTFASLNLITALPMNLIEGFSSMLLALLFAPALAKVFKTYSHKFWHNENTFEFKPIKNKWLTYGMSAILAIGATSGIVTLFLYNQDFLDWRQGKAGDNQRLDPNAVRDERLISTEDYNKIYDNLNRGDSAIVVVVGDKHWTFYAKASEEKELEELISNKVFYISFIQHPDKSLGRFLRQTFLTKSNQQISPDDSKGKIGTLLDFDSTPFIYVNGVTSSIGAHLKINSKDIIELSYNDFGHKFTGKASVSHTGDYYVNKYGEKVIPTSQIWKPIAIGMGTISLILIVIWTPNLVRKIKTKKQDNINN